MCDLYERVKDRAKPWKAVPWAAACFTPIGEAIQTAFPDARILVYGDEIASTATIDIVLPRGRLGIVLNRPDEDEMPLSVPTCRLVRALGPCEVWSYDLDRVLAVLAECAETADLATTLS